MDWPGYLLKFVLEHPKGFAAFLVYVVLCVGTWLYFDMYLHDRLKSLEVAGMAFFYLIIVAIGLGVWSLLFRRRGQADE